MTCDKSKAVSGDVVTVRGTVLGSNQKNVQVHFYEPGSDGYASWVPRACIVAIEEKPLQVGDKVSVPASRHIWKIIAIAEGHALIRTENGHVDHVNLAHAVTRAD